ncbi:MAG: GyrI-like domain-containing protein [Bacteroidales bacterium]|jgi:predicted transcriptional regulator YdeE|nr:GyrI-like domain-containing protein [Bacteroidales bacterium]
MDIKHCVKESFSVIGKEGSTNDGEGFIPKLWENANAHYHEIEAFVKKDANGIPIGFWGAMSDFSRQFCVWEDFSKGLYLAGAEVYDGTEPPAEWKKWIIPASEFLYVKVENSYNEIFSAMTAYLKTNNIELAGAVQDFISPQEHGQSYLYFPIKRL